MINYAIWLINPDRIYPVINKYSEKRASVGVYIKFLKLNGDCYDNTHREENLAIRNSATFYCCTVKLRKVFNKKKFKTFFIVAESV